MKRGNNAVEGNIVQYVKELERRISALERQEATVNELSELSGDMGLISAGEFRSGNGAEPGSGFSGVRMNASGVNGYDNDVLQSGISATDGKITAGAGAVILSLDGFSISAGGSYSTPDSFKIKVGNSVYDAVYDEYDASGHDFVIESRIVTDKNSLLRIKSSAPSGKTSCVDIVSGIVGGTTTNTRFDSSSTTLNYIGVDSNTIINGTSGAVLTVDAGDNDVDIATKMNFGDTGVLTGGLEALNDDTAASFTPVTPQGMMLFASTADTGTLYGILVYNTAAPTAYLMVTGSNTEVTTGALAGTTGTDAKFTVSCHTDGKIYLENRRGSARTVRWQILAGTVS